MTARKPAEPSFESWIEQQIQQAQREGLFDDLPGAGPLALRRSVEKVLEALPALRDERRVRELLEGVDAEIRRFNATATSGPPTTQAPLDVEAIVADGRRAREESHRE